MSLENRIIDLVWCSILTLVGGEILAKDVVLIFLQQDCTIYGICVSDGILSTHGHGSRG